MQPTDFPIIRAAISQRRAAQLDTALANVKAFAEEGVLIKAEWNEIKDTFSRAIAETWDAFKKANYYSRKTNDETTKLYWALLSPYPHTLAGYLKKAQAAKNIEPVILRDFPIEFFTEALPLNAMLVALKPLIGKRPPKKTKVEFEREGKERTCQICGRGILAEGGTIAHHGYRRPGDGYQSPSCPGALKLPFEIDRAVLGEHIVNLKDWLQRSKAYRAQVEAETVSLSLNYQVSEQDPRRAPGFKITVDCSISVTRDTFESLKAVKPEAFADKYNPRKEGEWRLTALTFDGLKEQALGMSDIEIGRISAEIARQEARYDGWKRTLVFVDGAYQPFLVEN